MLRITIKDKNNVLNFISTLPFRLKEALIKAMRESAVMVQSYAKLYAPVFRGMLRLSIAQNVVEEPNRIKAEIGSGLVYADVMEQGRRPWPYAMPPACGDLKTWARRKLGDERLSYVIARAIKRRGFTAKPYLKPAVEECLPRIKIIFNERINEALGAK